MEKVSSSTATLAQMTTQIPSLSYSGLMLFLLPDDLSVSAQDRRSTTALSIIGGSGGGGRRVFGREKAAAATRRRRKERGKTTPTAFEAAETNRGC